VAVDNGGNVYVADTENNRIQKFTSSGTYLTQWGSFGQGNGQFAAPYGVAVDSGGNVYVVDAGHSRIEVFARPLATLTPAPSETSTATPTATDTATPPIEPTATVTVTLTATGSQAYLPVVLNWSLAPSSSGW
jgi:DNA-binding beta-propeller fold protein YncE